MTSLTAGEVTSLVGAMSDRGENVADAYSSGLSEPLPGSLVCPGTPSRTVSTASTLSLPALSLAADPDRLNTALARLCISLPSHTAALLGGVPPAASAAVLGDSGAGQRRRRPVDRSASEPLSSSPSSAAVFDASAFCRYKTELCRPFEEKGLCKYGDKCQFAHGRAELRPVARHPKYKTDLCKTYHTTGLCPYGPRCHFIHNDEERHLNGLNRIFIEQRRTLFYQRQQQKQEAMMAAAVALAKRRHLSSAAASAVGACQTLPPRAPTVEPSRSPSPPSATVGEERTATMCVSDDSETAAVTAMDVLRQRLRQTAPQLSDVEVRTVLTRLFMGAVLADPSTSHQGYYHHPPYAQLQRSTHHQRAAGAGFNCDDRLLAL